MKAVSVKVESIPESLRALPRWVAWKHRGARKTPINCKSGRNADVADPVTWSTCEEAIAYYRARKTSGIGFVLGDGICGVDLDDCRDPQTGKLQDWAEEIVGSLDSYSEVSPSETGVKIFVEGIIPKNRRRGHIEVYGDKSRYFTVTGQRLSDISPLVENRKPKLLELFHHKLVSRTEILLDAKVLAMAKGSTLDGEMFTRLWEGCTGDYEGDESRADIALCAKLAYWTGGDARRVEELFGQSGLARREKWQRRDGYREMTINAAIIGQRTFYWPKKGCRFNTGGYRTIQTIQDHSGPYKVNTVAVQPVGSACGAEGLLHAKQIADLSPAQEDSAFMLARRLRRLDDKNPKQFRDCVKKLCELTGHEFDYV